MAWQSVFTTKAYAAKTIATGVLTLNSAGICYYVDGEGSVADNLVTISGASEGQMVVLKANGVVITIKHGTGNIALSGAADFALAAEEQFMLFYDGTNWRDIQTSGVGDFVLKSLYDADSVLAATNDDTPAAVALAEQTLLGRLTGGHPAAITIGNADNNIPQVDDAGGLVDNEYPRNTANGFESRSAAEVITDLLSAALPEDTVIQLDPLLAADEHWSGISILGEMGYSATVGDIVYLSSANHWELAKADAAATASGLLGIVLATTAEDSSCQVLLYGRVRSAAFPATFTIGAPVYLDYTNAGDVIVTMPAKTTNRVVRIVGYGLTAEDMMFAPDPTYIEYA
jgi:hypothetical protein